MRRICLDWKDCTHFRNAALLEENETPEFSIDICKKSGKSGRCNLG